MGFVAVDGVNLEVRKGSVHALIGPNGAGKTTCFNLLTKFLAPSGGTIHYKGRDITRSSPATVAEMGLVRSFQISAVFPQLTVLENVRVALQRRRGSSFDFWRSEKVLRSYEDEARSLIALVGLAGFEGAAAMTLSYGRKRALEIATTLALDPEVLLLDEPTAGMAIEDIERIVILLERVAQKRTLLMVEHNLSVVSRLCSRVSVLCRGQVIAEGDYKTVASDERVKEAYLGSNHA
ncbi:MULTISPECIES: ABC transporter ATP-binding protein [unclassified Chelatococcus]|uniref:ABC transporter ATP-binding protein n=1 Tax=unclassified Chelatococcus TaxID=2638111 RepID=UPI0020C14B08|nr:MULTISPECIES: ABC transporter ATP-binding protein [unclassified Chelatococcus]MCO5075466.1 ABC transporter ATP-binding protein [Chelatococcus sp.]